MKYDTVNIYLFPGTTDTSSLLVWKWPNHDCMYVSRQQGSNQRWLRCLDGNLKAGCLAGTMVVIVHWGKGWKILWAKAVSLRCFSIRPLKMWWTLITKKQVQRAGCCQQSPCTHILGLDFSCFRGESHGSKTVTISSGGKNKKYKSFFRSSKFF